MISISISNLSNSSTDGTTTTLSSTQSSFIQERGASLETFNGIAGTAVVELINNPKYINNEPDEREIIDGSYLEAPIDRAENFGSRLTTYIYAPSSGNYTLYVSSDDASVLYLSPDADPANKVEIAPVSGYTKKDDFLANDSQKSVPIYLEVGTPYYLEALHKEGSGGDHLSIAWESEDTGLVLTKIQEPYFSLFPSPTGMPPFTCPDSIPIDPGSVGLNGACCANEDCTPAALGERMICIFKGTTRTATAGYCRTSTVVNCSQSNVCDLVDNESNLGIISNTDTACTGEGEKCFRPSVVDSCTPQTRPVGNCVKDLVTERKVSISDCAKNDECLKTCFEVRDNAGRAGAGACSIRKYNTCVYVYSISIATL